MSFCRGVINEGDQFMLVGMLSASSIPAFATSMNTTISNTNGLPLFFALCGSGISLYWECDSNFFDNNAVILQYSASNGIFNMTGNINNTAFYPIGYSGSPSDALICQQLLPFANFGFNTINSVSNNLLFSGCPYIVNLASLGNPVWSFFPVQDIIVQGDTGASTLQGYFCSHNASSSALVALQTNGALTFTIFALPTVTLSFLPGGSIVTDGTAGFLTTLDMFSAWVTNSSSLTPSPITGLVTQNNYALFSQQDMAFVSIMFPYCGTSQTCGQCMGICPTNAPTNNQICDVDSLSIQYLNSGQNFLTCDMNRSIAKTTRHNRIPIYMTIGIFTLVIVSLVFLGFEIKKHHIHDLRAK